MRQRIRVNRSCFFNALARECLCAEIMPFFLVRSDNRIACGLGSGHGVGGGGFQICADEDLCTPFPPHLFNYAPIEIDSLGGWNNCPCRVTNVVNYVENNRGRASEIDSSHIAREESDSCSGLSSTGAVCILRRISSCLFLPDVR